MAGNETIIDTYSTIAQPAVGEYKEKGSKFMAYAFPVKTEGDVKEELEKLKAEHHKARHHCYAYRLGLDKTHNYRANDDGEPSGTAGRPILGQIDSKELTNLLVVVVRYFGGTKLGVSGLIRAYKTATRNALDEAETVERQLMAHYKLLFAYEQMNDVMQIAKQHELAISGQGYTGGKCTLQVKMPFGSSEQIVQALLEMDGLETQHLLTD